MPAIKPLPSAAPTSTSPVGVQVTSGTDSAFGTSATPGSPPSSYGQPQQMMANGSGGMDNGGMGRAGVPSQPAQSGGASTASDLLLSFLTQTVREMKEKMGSLEEENGHLRAKQRKLKRRVKESEEKYEQLALTVSTLSTRLAQQQQQQTAANYFKQQPSSSSSSSAPSATPSMPSSTSSSSAYYGSSYSSSSPAVQRGTKRPLQQIDYDNPNHLHGGSVPDPPPYSSISSLGASRYASSRPMTASVSSNPSASLVQTHSSGPSQSYTSGSASALAAAMNGYGPASGMQTYSLPSALQQQLDASLLGFPSYSLNTVGDILRHFPYLDECYFEKQPFVLTDLRKPFLVIQFVNSMESTTITASEAYCSLSGFTMHEVIHTKKLVALLPRNEKRRMIPLFIHPHEPKTTTVLDICGQILRKDGQIVRLEYQMQFFFDAHGKVKYLIASIEKMVGIDKSVLYANYAAFQENDEEKIKEVRDRLIEQEKEDWNELIQEYIRTMAIPHHAIEQAHSSSPTQQESPQISALPEAIAAAMPGGSRLQQQPEDLSSPPISIISPMTAAAMSSAADTTSLRPPSTVSAVGGVHSPPPSPSPLSPMTTNWLAEMLATPPTTTPQQSTYS